MKTKTTGIALIVIGILMIIYTGFNFKTTEKIADLGPVKITREKNNPIQWSPIVGGVLLIAGIVVLVTSKKSSM